MTSDAIPRPHPFSAQAGYDEDGQPDTGSPPVDLELDDPVSDDLTTNPGTAPAGLRVWLASAVREVLTLPEAFVEPANLMEIWDYANKAAFTTRTDGRGVFRQGNRAWAAVSMPITALLLIALWAQPRPGRCVAFVATLLLVGTGVAQIPVLGWIVPPLLDVTAW